LLRSCLRWAPLPAGPLRLVVLPQRALLPLGPLRLPARVLPLQRVPVRVLPQAQPAQD